MKIAPNYPLKKVIVGFSLCPAIVGLLAGPFGVYFGKNPEGIHWADLIVASIAASVLAAITSALFYFPPAFLLALIYAPLSLQLLQLPIDIVLIGGGGGAVFWGALLNPGREENGYFQTLIDAWLTQPFIITFLMGATSSLLMAWLVLPSPPPSFAAAIA